MPATFTVTTNADAGAGSLREAITSANATTDADTIVFAPTILGQTITLASALPAISQPLTITGPGQNGLTVSGNNAFRVFDIAAGTTATITDLTVTQGAANAAGENGGGIRNAGNLTLQRVTVSSSQANNAGGGVFNGTGATVTITDSTLVSNTATATALSNGGGLSNQGGTATLTRTTVAGNVSVFGGGLENFTPPSIMSVLQSSVYGNVALGGPGGGIRTNGTSVQVTNSTIALNTSTDDTGGGGVSVGAGSFTALNSTVSRNTDTSNSASGAGGISKLAGATLTLQNSIVAQNFAAPASAADVAGGIDTNLFTTVGGNPLLGPLQNNGGPTLSMAPLAGSPVIDAGNNALIAGTTVDQRGFNRVVGTAVDRGAVEFQPPTATTTLTINPNPSAFGQPVTYTAHVAGTATGSNTPTGTVTFKSGTTTLGTAPLDNSGNATLTTANVPRGTNSVTATYSGDANFNSSVSAAVTERVFLRYTPGVFDPATANWYLRNSNSAGAPDIGPFNFGAPGWIPVVGDWNGDGTVTVGVVDPSTMTWYLRNENSSGAPDVATPFQFGLPGWVPVAGDWGGSGHWGIGVFDPGTATWFLRNEAGPGTPDAGTFQFGGPGWIPVVGDWDGNGTFTIGVVNPTGPGGNLQWFLRNSNTPGAPDIGPFAYGLTGWKPITGDWTAQGFTTIGVVDPSNNNWFLRNSNSSGAPDITPFGYGAPGWTPVSGDWIKPAATTTATAITSGVTRSLAANMLVTGLRRTQALDQVFASGSLGAA